jgi:phage shock protein A
VGKKGSIYFSYYQLPITDCPLPTTYYLLNSSSSAFLVWEGRDTMRVMAAAGFVAIESSGSIGVVAAKAFYSTFLALSKRNAAMGLIDRILRVIRANLSHLVGQAEDPEKILEQTVLDMQEDLIELRQAVAGAIATFKRTERQAQQAQSSSEEWYRRAQLALQKGDDNLAREALTRRKAYQETATALSSQLEQQNAIVTRLKQDMRTIESKLVEAKTKKDMYIARARSAQATQRLNEMTSRFNPSGSLSAFERMEEKVLQLEARSEAIAELGTNELEKKFAALEAGGDIDTELQAMKAQIAGGNNPPQLPASKPPGGNNPEL